jgi:hypothetical protein
MQHGPLPDKTSKLTEFRDFTQSRDGNMIAYSMLRVVVLKPSKYGPSSHVERFRRGFMPNSTVPYLRSMTPMEVDGVPIQTFAIDEYVQTDLSYLNLLRHPDQPTLLALVGVQSHQFQRALDLAAFAAVRRRRPRSVGFGRRLRGLPQPAIWVRSHTSAEESCIVAGRRRTEPQDEACHVD